MKFQFYVIVFLVIIQACKSNPDLLFKSPDGQIESQLVLSDDSLNLNLVFQNETIVRKLDFNLSENEKSLLQGIKIEAVYKFLVNETWNTIIGKNKTVQNHYQHYLVDLKNKDEQVFQIEIRIYNK